MQRKGDKYASKSSVLKKSYDPRAKIIEEQEALGKLQHDPVRGECYYGNPLHALQDNGTEIIDKAKAERDKHQDQNNSVTTNSSTLFAQGCKPTSRLRKAGAVRIYDGNEPIKIDREGHTYIGRSIDEVFANANPSITNHPANQEIFILDTESEDIPSSKKIYSPEQGPLLFNKNTHQSNEIADKSSTFSFNNEMN